MHGWRRKIRINKISRNEDIVARRIHDTYFLIDITDNYADDTCILYQINETGFFIWDHINGKRSSNDLAHLLKSATDSSMDYQEILADVRNFLHELRNKRFIEGKD